MVTSLKYYSVDVLFCQLEMKQRFLVGKMNVPDEKEGGHDEVTMETLGEDSTFLFVNAVTSSSSLLLTCVIFCLSS